MISKVYDPGWKFPILNKSIRSFAQNLRCSFKVYNQWTERIRSNIVMIFISHHWADIWSSCYFWCTCIWRVYDHFIAWSVQNKEGITSQLGSGYIIYHIFKIRHRVVRFNWRLWFGGKNTIMNSNVYNHDWKYTIIREKWMIICLKYYIPVRIKTIGYIDVGGGCWTPNVNTKLDTNIKYQSPTSYSGVLWCWWPM